MDSTGHSNKRIRKMEDEETEFSDSEVPPPLPIQFQAEANFTPDFNMESQEFQKMQQDSQARLRTLLEVAGVSDLDPQTFSDPEILRRLTSSVSNALDEAASALTRMRQENQSVRQDTHMKIQEAQATNVAIANVAQAAGQLQDDSSGTLSEACNQGDIRAVQKLLGQGRSVHEPGEEGESLLSLACSAGYYELAEVLLRMRAGVEDRGLKGEHEHTTHTTGDCTPLMEAASGGYSDIVRLLIDHGADVNAKSAAGNTALTYACCGGYEDVVQLLLEASAFVEEQNENGHTPLMEAASGGHIGVAKLLLEHGAGINTHSNEFKESALTLACYKGHLDMVKFLLDAGADQEHKTDEMHTALMEASMDGHVDVARLLLDHGAQVNMPADSFESPLTLAACGGHLDLAALLISRGANLEEVNDEGYTPLMEAAREGHEDVVALLIEQGAYINAQTDETQETALTLACCGGFLEVVQLLVEKGADIEKGASTPLMEASQEGHIDIVKYILDRGANVHAETATKDTAITYACANGHTNVAALLLDYGADLEHKSEAGRTPLMKASRAGHLETVQFLVEKGAFVNTATTSNDHTVLSLACAGGHLSVVQYLLMQNADVGHVLKDNSNMLIEAAKGGHTAVACLIMEQPLHPARASKHRVTKKGNVTTVASEMNSVGVQQPRKPKKSTSSSSSQAAQHKATVEEKKPSTSTASGGPAEVERPSIDKMTLAEMESVIKADLEKRDKEKQDKYQEPLDSQKEKELQWMESQRKLLQFSMQYWKNRPPEDFLKVQQEFANLRTEEIMQKVLENAKSVLNDEKFNFPSVKDLPRPSRDDIIRFQEMLALRMQATTSDQAKQQQETSLYSSSSDASECGSEGDESVEDSDPDDLYGDDDLDLSTQLAINIDAQTESTHDTALTVCCSGGHDELVQVLLARGADLEHRDKKGCSPLILAASAGHAMTVSILLDHGANIEAMSDRTKDTSLSLACSGGRQEVVDILLSKSSNYEHRNVSDYTPLSLAASGGYVAIIKSLLRAGAEINSRTGSKLGISPLMLAAMNGHTSAVKLLLDTGADINAQIETNRNTALTLACFQGRHEVVSLLCERGANVEHRAKTGLTPLMEAASGGYHEVGKVLIECGADVNASPVPTSRDTALTIASDKGHFKFVELILSYGANVDVKNKKGNSPLWLACNGGHFDVVKLLVSAGADVDSQDNRKVFCLMAAFRKGHVRVVKYLVDFVTQFPSDTECTRYIATISDKEMLKKCSQCMEIIVCAKDRQAAEANKNASILLQQLDDERKNEESKKAAAAKRRAKKKRQREKKQKAKEQEPSEDIQEDDNDEKDEEEFEPKENSLKVSMATATSKDIGTSNVPLVTATATITTKSNKSQNAVSATSTATVKATTTASTSSNSRSNRRGSKSSEHTKQSSSSVTKKVTLAITTITTTSPVFTVAESSNRSIAMATGVTPSPSPRRTRNKEAEGWKEVGKRSKRITLSGGVANYVIGKNNIHMRIIEDITGVQIILDKYEKPNQDRVITLHGTAENTKQAHHYISQLAKGKEKNIRDVLPPSVVKRFNLDAATNQYSIASSLDSFDVDAVAPPASPAVSSEHTMEKKPPLIQTVPHTNTTVDTRSAKKGNATITTTRTTVTAMTHSQHFLPVTQGPAVSTKRQLFPVQGSDQHSAAIADNPDHGLFSGTAAPVKSCSGIIFSSSVTVTSTQCTTVITPATCKSHNCATTSSQGIISSASVTSHFGKRPAVSSSVIASKATTRGTSVNQVVDKVGKSSKNSTGKNVTKSSASAVKQASTLKSAGAVTSQHSGSAPKKKSLYSSAVVGSQSQVTATTNTINTQDNFNSENNNEHNHSIKPLFSSPLVQPQPTNNNGIYRPFGPIADVESDVAVSDTKENISPKAVGAPTTIVSNSLGPIGRPVKDFRMANSSPPDANRDHGVLNMHMDRGDMPLLDDGNQLDERLDLEVIELAPSVPFPIGTPKNDQNTPSPKKSYSPTLNYDSAFRPIHAPTTKSSRPPLLRTPPGFPPPQMQYTLLQNQPHAVPVAAKDSSPQSIIGGSTKQSFPPGSPAVTSHSLPRQNSDSPVTMHVQHQPSVMSVSQPSNVQFGNRPSSNHGWGSSSQANPIFNQSNQQQQNSALANSMLHSVFNPNAPAFIPMRSTVTVPSNSFMGSQLPPSYHPNIILATPAPIPTAQSMGQMSQLEQAFPQQYLPTQHPVVPNHTLAPGYQSHPMPGYSNSQIAAPGGGLLGIIPSANDPAQVFTAPASQPVFLHRVPTPSYLPGAQPPLPLNSQPMRQTSVPTQPMNVTAKQQPLMSAVQPPSQQFGNDQMGMLPESGNHNGSTLQKSLNSSYDNYLPPMASAVMDSEQQLGKGVEYDGPLSDKLAPIGTERAHKRSSSLTETQNIPPLANSLLTDGGGLWSYNATPEVSGWGSSNSSLPEEDQASLLSPSDDRPESGKGVASDTEWPKENIEEFTLQPDDTLQSVLGRLNLSKHIPLFQQNEIDLHALLLMKEKDYSEIGLPKGPRLKLLSAIGNKRTTNDDSLGMLDSSSYWPDPLSNESIKHNDVP